MKKQNSEAGQLLAQAGLKKTDARVFLLELLAGAKKPLGATAIATKLANKEVDRVTVYRMLDIFAEKGIVRRVDTGSRETQYEVMDHSDDHHHVICLSCNKVSDFTGCDGEKVVAQALKQVKDFDTISHHSFDLFGTCRACAKK